MKMVTRKVPYDIKIKGTPKKPGCPLGKKVPKEGLEPSRA
jgi:hypothetical protein